MKLTILGATGATGTTLTSQALAAIGDSVRSIIQAMSKTGTRRFLQVSGSVVADEGESPYLRYLLKPLARRTFLRHVCADLAACMLASLSDPATVHRHVAIAS